MYSDVIVVYQMVCEHRMESSGSSVAATTISLCYCRPSVEWRTLYLLTGLAELAVMPPWPYY